MIRFEADGWKDLRFRTGVSLHGHTLCSRESLAFIYKLADRIAPIRSALARGMARYREIHGTELDLHRAWWTPPLAPHDAWLLEKHAIEERLGVNALVSLSDHDNIDAPLLLRVLDECRDVPISVEWTVPFDETFLHLGIHNLAPGTAREIMTDLEACTAHPSPARVRELMARLAADPAVLIVFNHPCWDECGLGQDRHRSSIRKFAADLGPWWHACEINGLRPWAENRDVIAFASEYGKPLISGGDRHAMEPSTVLNLTQAPTFTEFAAEVRDGHSELLVTSRYAECFALRILNDLEQILAYHEGHGRGWRTWSDRVFYQCDDGVVRSMSELWGARSPLAVRLFVGGVQALRVPAMQGAFRAFLGGRQEIAL